MAFGFSAAVLFGVSGCSVFYDAGSATSVHPAEATAESESCDQFFQQTVQNRYIVRNNRFGSKTAWQCLQPTDDGFVISQFAGANPTSGNKPVGYPSIIYGCFYGRCSPGTQLPARLTDIHAALTSASFGYVPGAAYHATYDIFLDPSPDVPKANQLEIMIYFRTEGVPDPPSSNVVGDVSIAGKDWQVRLFGPWGNGGNSIVYAAKEPLASWGFDALDFIADAKNRGLAADDWYLTSVQTGFECWHDCAGLAVNSFTAEVR